MRFTFKASDFIFLGFVVAVIIFVTWLPTPRQSNPPTPNDSPHRSIKLQKDCLACHIQTGQYPLPARHPKRQDCFRCHREPTI